MFEINVIPVPGLATFLTNRHITIKEAIETPPLSAHKCVQMEQTHGDTIVTITENIPAFSEVVPVADALVTQQRGVALLVRTADCLPILIAHPASGTIAGIHAGRVGTQKQILKKTLDLIRPLYEKKSGPLHIWFGPHICKSCYQINKDTDEHYDLTEENKAQILNTLSSEDYFLYEDPRCTKCCNTTFYSYRAEGEKSGRFHSIISLSMV